MWLWFERLIGRGPEYWAAKYEPSTVRIVKAPFLRLTREQEIARWRELLRVLEEEQQRKEKEDEHF